MITKSKNINRPWLRLLCLCLAMCMLVGMLPATVQAATPSKLYLKPNSNWKVDNARFAAYFFGNGEKWVSGVKVDTDLYMFEVPAGFPKVIFCRMNPSNTGNNWDNRWNQTADLAIPTNGNNCYSIKSGTWDKGGGTWSTIATCKYEGHSGTPSYVPGGNGTHTQKYSCCGEPYGTAESCTNNAEYPCYDGKCKLCGGAVSGVPHVSDAEYSCQAGSCKVCGKEMSQPSHSWSSEYPCQDAVCTICGIDMPKVDHQWKDATCTAPKTCSVCGETEGEALGHDWVDGTCSQPKTCSVCGETEGDILPHNFIDEKCEYCHLNQYVTIYFQNNWKWSDVCLYYWYSDNTPGATWPGTAMEFYGNDGKYDVYAGKIPYNTYGVIVNGIKDDGSTDRDQTPDIKEGWYDGICYYMLWDDGNQVGSEDINVILPPCEHIWKDASCNEPVTCELCGATSGEALGHAFCAPTCTEPETCIRCGLTQGEALGHSWGNAVVTDPTCTEDGYTTYSCSVCGDSCVDDKVAAKGHTMSDADCTTPATCSVCGETEGEALGHEWDDATCTAPKTCSVCGETEGEALGHEWDDATCTAPKTCSVCGETEGEALGHEWDDATCTAPKTCSVCGETEGEALGHEWDDATCTAPKTCSVCGETEGEALGHEWDDATCTAPKTCSVCGETEGEALGHDWDDATCTAPKTCSVCGEYEGEALGHDWDDATCTAPKTCSVCGETEGEALGHKWDDATCTAPKTCSVCGETEGEALGHDWDDATCTAPKTCSVCGETEGEALGHDWDDATCTAPKTCSVCGETEGEALGHDWDDATCTAAKTCSVCGETEGEALGHDWDDATCTAPKTCSVCGETEGAVIDHKDQDNNGRCDYCSCLMQDAKLSMASISLKGNIAINYYMLLSDEALADKTAYMQFTLADGEIRQIPVSEGVKHEYYGEIYYVFTCAVDAKEMTDDVLSQFFYAGGSSKEYTYSVQTYADYILTNSSNTKMKALVAAMLNYGAASQIHFNYRTDDLANAGLEAPDYANVNITGFGAVSGQGTELAKLYSASLILKSETTLRFFFRVEGSATLTVTYNGQPLEVMERSGLYYVDIVGISAKDMSESVTVTISDGTSTTEVFFNPMSYCQGVLNDKTGAFGAEMKNLVCALYLYNQAANSYFGEG